MLQILTIAAASNLPNVIRLKTVTKVQVFNHAPDTSFNGDVGRFRSTRTRSEMFIRKIVGAEVSTIKGVILTFEREKATGARIHVLRSRCYQLRTRLRDGVRISNFVDSLTRS